MILLFKNVYLANYTRYVKAKEIAETEDEDEESTAKNKKTKKSSAEESDESEGSNKKNKSSDDEDENSVAVAGKDNISISWDEKLVKSDKTYVGDGKVILLTPHYNSWTIKDEDRGTYNLIASEEGKNEMINSINIVLPRVMPNAEILSTPSSEEADKLNEIAILNDWANEKISNGKLAMVSVDYEQVKAIGAKHKADDMVLLSVSSVRSKMSGAEAFFELFVGCFTVVYLPVAIYNISKPVYNTHLYTITINFDKDKIVNPMQ